MNGYCRTKDGDRDQIRAVGVNDVGRCYAECKAESRCVAFAYTPANCKECDLYQGGPYSTGNGVDGAACYTMLPSGNYVNGARLFNRNCFTAHFLKCSQIIIELLLTIYLCKQQQKITV